MQKTCQLPRIVGKQRMGRLAGDQRVRKVTDFVHSPGGRVNLRQLNNLAV